MPEKLTKDIFINRSIIIHNHKYDYSLVNYIRNNIKVKIICPTHGLFEQIPNSHLLGKGCSICSKNVKLTTKEFIERSIISHGNYYDYSKSIYTTSNSSVIIICPKHGYFNQIANHHMRGIGCTKCGEDFKKISFDDFLKRSNLIHNNKYNYSLSIYVNSYSKLIIKCPVHDAFKQSPMLHMYGQGCLKCAPNANKGKDKFIIQANKVHNNNYLYDNLVYINGLTKSIITCKIHGDFLQRPANHLSGQGCVKCTSSISNAEIEWLDLLGIQQNNRQKVLTIDNKKIKVDAYDPETNTIYEFYGNYWHGNPEKFSHKDINKKNKISYKKLYDDTLAREKIIKDAGFNLITIWESEFKKQKKLCSVP